MGRKRKNTRVSKHNIAQRGNGGFTLAELCIVMAIVAISSAMIVAFSVSMKQFLTSNAEEYEFLEDCAAVEEALHEWIAEKDISEASWSTDNTQLSVGGDIIPGFSNGTLDLGDKKIENLHTVGMVTFEIQGNLIKCNVTRVGSESVDKSYVFALRCQGGAAG